MNERISSYNVTCLDCGAVATYRTGNALLGPEYGCGFHCTNHIPIERRAAELAQSVRIERRAAQLAASACDARASWRYRRALGCWSADENRGWRAHLLGVAAERDQARAWLAGWLAREIWTHEQEDL